ncbi:hypothetical protein BGZ73_002930 [Actinomortierella ambigua]|nr:hypothetical protein BGZ73_002930 [Actinomortierella ambigua]
MKLQSVFQTLMVMAMSCNLVLGYTLMRCKRSNRTMTDDWDHTKVICDQLGSGGRLMRVCLRAAQEYCMVEAAAGDNQGAQLNQVEAFKARCLQQNSANIVSTC